MVALIQESCFLKYRVGIVDERVLSGIVRRLLLYWCEVNPIELIGEEIKDGVALEIRSRLEV